MKKLVGAALSLLAAVFVFAAGTYFGATQSSFILCLKSSVMEGQIQSLNICRIESNPVTVSQRIMAGSNGGEFFNYEVPGDTTAIKLLQTGENVEMEGTGANAFVTAINGHRADKSKKEFWSFYVNGKMADVGAGSYKLMPGDKIEWKLETY